MGWAQRLEHFDCHSIYSKEGGGGGVTDRRYSYLKRKAELPLHVTHVWRMNHYTGTLPSHEVAVSVEQKGNKT